MFELRRGGAGDDDGDEEEVSGRFQGSVSVANPPVFGRGTSGPTRGSEDEPAAAWLGEFEPKLEDQSGALAAVWLVVAGLCRAAEDGSVSTLWN